MASTRTSIVISSIATILIIFALAASALHAGSRPAPLTWSFWIQTTKPKPTRLLVRDELSRERSGALAFLQSQGLALASIRVITPTIEKYYGPELPANGTRNSRRYVGSQQLTLDSTDYRRLAALSNEVTRQRALHPDWSSSFPDNGTSGPALISALLVLISLISGVYVVATAEIGRTYSATLPVPTGKAPLPDAQTKRMHPGLVAIQTIGIGAAVLLCWMYWLIDFRGARLAFIALVAAQAILTAAWLFWTNESWNQSAFFVRARAAYWSSIVIVAIAFGAALSTVR